MLEQDLVLFCCLHASTKSSIAANCFDQRAAEQGVLLRALSMGTDPDKSVPPHVVAGMRGDGYDEIGRAHV